MELELLLEGTSGKLQRSEAAPDESHRRLAGSSQTMMVASQLGKEQLRHVHTYDTVVDRQPTPECATRRRLAFVRDEGLQF